MNERGGGPPWIPTNPSRGLLDELCASLTRGLFMVVVLGLAAPILAQGQSVECGWDRVAEPGWIKIDVSKSVLPSEIEPPLKVELLDENRRVLWTAPVGPCPTPHGRNLLRAPSPENQGTFRLEVSGGLYRWGSDLEVAGPDDGQAWVVVPFDIIRAKQDGSPEVLIFRNRPHGRAATQAAPPPAVFEVLTRFVIQNRGDDSRSERACVRGLTGEQEVASREALSKRFDVVDTCCPDEVEPAPLLVWFSSYHLERDGSFHVEVDANRSSRIGLVSPIGYWVRCYADGCWLEGRSPTLGDYQPLCLPG